MGPRTIFHLAMTRFDSENQLHDVVCSFSDACTNVYVWWNFIFFFVEKHDEILSWFMIMKKTIEWALIWQDELETRRWGWDWYIQVFISVHIGPYHDSLLSSVCKDKSKKYLFTLQIFWHLYECTTACAKFILINIR